MAANQRTCDQCGKIWQVSISVMQSQSYICPHCSSEKKKAAPVRATPKAAKNKKTKNNNTLIIGYRKENVKCLERY